MGLLLSIRNPEDLTSTYAQIEISRADSEGGSYSVIATENIDTTTASDYSTGYTDYSDSTGSTSKWYKFRYKTSTSDYSNYSDEFQGGLSVMHTRFRRRMRDTNSNNYFFTNSDIDNLLKDAVYSLYPTYYDEGIDETLSTDGSTRKFTFPVGVTKISELEFLNSSGDSVALPKSWSQRGRQILFDYVPASGYTIRLFVEKMVTDLKQVPSVFDEYILDRMCLGAYMDLEADRARFHKYNSIAKAEGGNLPSLRLIIDRLQDKTERRLLKLKRSRKASTLNI